MAELINIPRYVLMLIGYLCFLFGSGGLTFQIFSFSQATGELSVINTLIPVLLMAVGIVLVFIATKLNKFKGSAKANSS